MSTRSAPAHIHGDMGAGATTPSCSVVIAAYDVARLPLLERAVASVTAPGVEVVVAIDNNPDLAAIVAAVCPDAVVVRNDGLRGASATRNTGARAARGNYLAFLDDDAEAAPGWLEALVAPLREDASIVGVGGWIDAGWATERPAWFPMEFGWVVGASYTGLPTDAGEVRNVWSENMAVRAEQFWRAGGFREGFGKVDGANRPEDTELCLRLARTHPGGRWWLEPRAVIRHHVPAERATAAYFWERCRAEGLGKAELARLTGPDEGLASERGYAAQVLPRGVLAGFGDLLRGRPAGVLRALAIVVGLTAAVLGFAQGSVSVRRRAGSAPAETLTPTGPATLPDGPARVMTVDLAGPLPDLAAPAAGEPAEVLAVVTLCEQPVGMLTLPSPTAAPALATRITQALGLQLSAAARRHGLPTAGLASTALTAAGLPHDECPVRGARAMLAEHGPGVTVALCTRNRPEQLRRCLASVVDLAYRDRQILVVDNAPDDDATERVCRDFDVEYLREPTPGLSHARNAALLAARHDLIAFLDDDETVDRHWLSALVTELAEPEVAAVTGLVLPAELATEAQARFEHVGGHSKDRGFARVVLDREHQRTVQSPVYPKPTFGAGANMAFRVRALREIGGFDVALGAGTRTRGGEDTLAFSEVMLAGHTLVYTPAALTWHYHRDDEAALADQLAGYRLGLGGYYAALVRRDPTRIVSLARGAVQVARARTAWDGVEPEATREYAVGGPRQVRAMAAGAWSYLRTPQRAESS